jgi:hypothetical protein
MTSRSVEFFDRQFRRQSEAGEYALNPFEEATLPFLHGQVLDLGCGLRNLSLAAAGNGCSVTALDASPAAIDDLSLVEGTSYMDMFDPDGYCLFGRDELTARLRGWQALRSRHDDFPAPGGTLKRFHTLVARRPA